MVEIYSNSGIFSEEQLKFIHLPIWLLFDSRSIEHFFDLFLMYISFCIFFFYRKFGESAQTEFQAAVRFDQFIEGISNTHKTNTKTINKQFIENNQTNSEHIENSKSD